VTISGWTTIATTEGYQLIDMNGDGTGEPYYVQWDTGSQSINDTYEFSKWITQRGATSTIFGMNGELFRGITHEFNYDNEAVSAFSQNEIVTFGNAATGAVLAVEDNGATGTMWIQLLTGVAPANDDTIVGGSSGTTADVDGVVDSKSVPQHVIGTSTGTNIIGAYGVAFDPLDVTASDQFFDLDNILRVPPNNVTFTVNGLVSGEDRVLVGPYNGDTAPNGDPQPDFDQLTLDGALTLGATTVSVTTTIPSDTPSAGTIRIFNGDTFELVEYGSYSGTDFLGCTGVVASDDAANVFISYIDTLASDTFEDFTTVYSTNRSLLIRVRDGGGTPIKTFITTGTLGSAGGSTTAIRTTDV